MDKNEIIQELIKLEPVFIKAGDLAAKLQKNAESQNKFNTGAEAYDIVTEADFEVQEEILGIMAKTALRQCRLLAEEDTPSTKLFNSKGDFLLTLDPIDGTKLYAKGDKYWSVIISLRDDKEIFYTFNYFPAANWGHKIIGKNYEQIGEKPKIKVLQDTSKIISYSYGSTDVIERKIYNEIIEQGYNFKLVKELTSESGSTALFLAGQVAGYFNPIALIYDSLVAYHFAQAMDYKIYSVGLDLSKIEKNEKGMVFHPGYYIAIRK
jgi:fructose-1,6-bisphosphatase/inositol monophosphatase family enzyme